MRTSPFAWRYLLPLLLLPAALYTVMLLHASRQEQVMPATLPG